MIKKTTTDKEYIEWSEIDAMCNLIILRAKELNFNPDIILTPLRGGVIPAVIISHKLNIQDLVTIIARRTKDNSVEAERIDVSLDKLPIKKDVENKKILIFDDIADSGETLERVYSMMIELGARKIMTAVLFTNSKRFNRKNRKPDISIKETSKWIVFPWE